MAQSARPGEALPGVTLACIFLVDGEGLLHGVGTASAAG